MRQVVITGVGAISGNGNNLPEIWSNLLQGEAHRSKITHFPIDDPKYARSCATAKEGLIDTVCGSPLTNEELFALTGISKGVQRYDRHQLFAIVAVKEAIADAQGFMSGYFPHRIAILGGTGDGGLMESCLAHEKLSEGGKLDPFSNLRQLPNIFIGHIANMFGIQGPGFVHVTACAASAHALQDAARLIKLGEADAAVVVGAEAAITPFGIASFVAQRALSKESRPYQKDRIGFLMGEGAGALILEDREQAIARGATILAEVAGYGATTDGNTGAQITDPDFSGGARAAKLALDMAGITAEELTYINTHGTGTPVGDTAELKGIEWWAGTWAHKVLISSTKSFSGHLLGAAGAYELALCVTMLRKGYVLPTCGLTSENVDPEFAGFNHVMHTIPFVGRFLLSNSFGFGGANASVVLKRH